MKREQLQADNQAVVANAVELGVAIIKELVGADFSGESMKDATEIIAVEINNELNNRGTDVNN